MNGWLAGLAGGLEAAGNFGQQKLDKLWQERKMKLIEEQQMRLQDRQNQRRDMEYERNRADQISDDARKIKEQVAIENWKQNQKNNSPKTKAEIARINAETELANAKKGLLDIGVNPSSGKPIGGVKKVKKIVTDQKTGQSFKIYENGDVEPLMAQSVETVPTPFVDAGNTNVVLKPVYGEIKGGREAGERDYLNAYNDYYNKFTSNVMNKGKQPLSYEEYVSIMQGKAPQPREPKYEKNDPVGAFLDGLN